MPKGYRGGGSGVGGYSAQGAIVNTTRESAEKTAQYNAEYNALNARMQKEYGWTLNSNIRNQQDWRVIRDSVYGIESVMKEFSGAQQYLRGGEYSSDSLSLGTLGQANLGRITIKTNNSYMRDQNTLDLVMQSTAKHGFHPAGSRAQGVTTHEAGHLLVTAIAKKQGTFFYDSVARNIVNKAFKTPAVQAEAKRMGLRSTAKWGMARSISQYATSNEHETIAEAVSDYMANRSKANVFSRAIVREIKMQLK